MVVLKIQNHNIQKQPPHILTIRICGGFAFRHLNTLYSCCIPTLKELQSGHCAVSKHFGGIGVFIEYQDFFRNGFRKISSPFINFKIKATDASRTDGFKAQLNFMKTQPSKDSCL